MKKIALLIALVSVNLWGQQSTSKLEQKWVDSVYQSMDLKQRIGQLFMVAAYSNKGEAHVKSLEKLVQEQEIGGLIFFQGGPKRQAQMTNRLQSLSHIPMLIGIDGEWGLSMRLDSTYRFPWNMTLGAIQNLDLIEETGVRMAQQSKRLGLQFNFGPVVDININPKNPIIGVRSFGETRELVTEHALAFMKGFQSQHIFATGKHFPGHGDTATDSHYSLPLLDFSKDRLNKVELYPYRKMIHEGLASVMVGHLSLPSIEPDKNIPTSLSYNVVTKLLREEMGFEGLIFTDALNMKAAANYLKPGEVDLAAFMAGNDLLLFSEDVPVASQKIQEAYNSGVLTEKRLAYSVKKVLKYKFRSGLKAFTQIEATNLIEDLNSSVYDDLNQKLYNEAMTLLKNDKNIIPIKHLEKEKIAYLKLGDDDGQGFLQALQKFTQVDELTSDNLENADQYTKIIIGYHKLDNPWRNHDLKASEIDLIARLASKHKVVFVSFAKAYALSGIYNFKSLEGVLQAYQNNEFAQSAAAQIIFGTIGAKGKLPVTVSEEFRVHDGLKTKSINRLGFSTLGNEGLDPFNFKQIDAIVNDAIAKQFMPGAQLVVVRHGKVVYEKAYGYHSYEKQNEVKSSDLYDLASLTKILGTMPMMLKMYDVGKVTLHSTLGSLLKEFKNTDKEKITLEELLTHQAGFPAWIPFYKRTLNADGKPSSEFYRTVYSPSYPLQVSEHLFLKKNYNLEILKQISESNLSKKKEYKYSDLGFIALKEVVERSYHKPLDELAEDNFYKKIGASTMTFNPLKKFDMDRIPPTEEDGYFRFSKVQGYVHDMTAAMEGGVAGHAGLFANALDVAKMMQLFMNKGVYGDENYFSQKTFEAFNTCVYCKSGNRRGIGFDKPQSPGKPGPTCGCASMTSFGHTGFTGTMAWADPEKDLIFVFLSNRTYPDSNDNKLSKANVREDIQQLIYDAIIN